MNDLEPLYLYITKRRQALGLTQRYLADRLGYTPQAISKFESGENEIALNVLPMLGNVLDLSMNDIFARRIPSGKLTEANKTIDLSLLTKNLWALRYQKKLTQKQEAVQFGVSERSVRNYEKADSFPSISFVEAVMDYYQVGAEELLYQDLHSAAQSQRRHQIFKIVFPVLAFLLVGGAAIGVPVAIHSSQNHAVTSSSALSEAPASSAAPVSETSSSVVSAKSMKKAYPIRSYFPDQK
jgi:transcriptional regulator with XRE-family HTH domain